MTKWNDTFRDKNTQEKGNKTMCEIPREIKIIHIHKGSELKKSFIEFLVLNSGKRYTLNKIIISQASQKKHQGYIKVTVT